MTAPIVTISPELVKSPAFQVCNAGRRFERRLVLQPEAPAMDGIPVESKFRERREIASQTADAICLCNPPPITGLVLPIPPQHELPLLGET